MYGEFQTLKLPVQKKLIRHLEKEPVQYSTDFYRMTVIGTKVPNMGVQIWRQRGIPNIIMLDTKLCVITISKILYLEKFA
jgi:hypothetical protein